MKYNVYYLVDTDDSGMNYTTPIQKIDSCNTEVSMQIVFDKDKLIVKTVCAMREDLVLEDSKFDKPEVFSVAVSDMSAKIVYVNDEKRFSDRSYQTYITESTYLKTLKDSFIIASVEDNVMNIVVKKKCEIITNDGSDVTLIPITIMHEAYKNSRAYLSTKSDVIANIVSSNARYMDIYGQVSLDKSISSLEKQVDFLMDVVYKLVVDKKDEIEIETINKFLGATSLVDNNISRSLLFKNSLRRVINANN